MNRIIKHTVPSSFLQARLPWRRTSASGTASKPFILYLGVLLVAAAAIMGWHQHHPAQERDLKEPILFNLNTEKDSGSGDIPVTTEAVAEEPEDDYTNVRELIQEVFKVERVHHSGDTKRQERDIARREFRRIREKVRELREQGLEGDALYAAAAEQLVEVYGPDILRMLEGQRLLEQELGQADLDAMSPIERFEYIHKARLHAFGPDLTDMLFFEKEAFARSKLDEQAILEDTSLTAEEQQEKIENLRHSLQVELASRGTYVSFADQRYQELEDKLRERYGTNLEDISPEERQNMMWEMYREELPPAIMEKAERVMAAQERKRAAREAFKQKRETIMNDPGLSFEQKQELLINLSDHFNNPDS